MKKEKKRGSLIRQVTVLFLISTLLTGFLTFISQRVIADENVTEQMETLTAQIAEETAASIKEYPSYAWLIRYWHDHWDELDIEYDVTPDTAKETKEKCRLLSSRYPGIQPRYSSITQVQAMSEEDQKLFAEVLYSWILTRLNQIKRTYHIDFLFCVMTDETYEGQFFLMSASDPGATRGTTYKDVYTLGVTVTVSESQKEAMMRAMEKDSYFTDAGEYVDYYVYLDRFNDNSVLLGMTYNLSEVRSSIRSQTVQRTFFAMIYQILLAVIAILLVYAYVLSPLKEFQTNIRRYNKDKDSSTVVKNLAEVRPNNEIGELSEDISELTIEIDDYTKRIRSITAEKERIETELSLAEKIQRAMLPHIFPPFPNRSEFSIYAMMDPAREVGGDFYDFFLIDEDHLGLTIADVSGKGIPAALFMMMSKILLQSHAMPGRSAAEVLSRVNEVICANNSEEMFVTVWFGILEISTGTLKAANAGHEYPAIRRADGEFELLKDKHGFVIGGMEGVRYKEYELSLRKGDRIFVYTDGVPEATDADGEMFGTDRMLAALNEVPETEPDKLLVHVRESVDAFVKDAEQFDDLTMLCLEYNGK